MDDMAQVMEEMQEAKAEASATEVTVDEDEEGITEQLTPAQLQEAGWSIIWHIKTGVSSRVNNNWLLHKLAQTKDGERVWTADRTKAAKPVRGTYKCLLHPDDPNRAEYDMLGFPTCPKHTLTNRYQQTRHMQKRHKSEWAAIMEMRQEAKEKAKEDREVAMLEALTGKKTEPQEEPELYVSPNPKRKKRK